MKPLPAFLFCDDPDTKHVLIVSTKTLLVGSVSFFRHENTFYEYMDKYNGIITVSVPGFMITVNYHGKMQELPIVPELYRNEIFKEMGEYFLQKKIRKSPGYYRRYLLP